MNNSLWNSFCSATYWLLVFTTALTGLGSTFYWLGIGLDTAMPQRGLEHSLSFASILFVTETVLTMRKRKGVRWLRLFLFSCFLSLGFFAQRTYQALQNEPYLSNTFLGFGFIFILVGGYFALRYDIQKSDFDLNKKRR